MSTTEWQMQFLATILSRRSNVLYNFRFTLRSFSLLNLHMIIKKKKNKKQNRNGNKGDRKMERHILFSYFSFVHSVKMDVKQVSHMIRQYNQRYITENKSINVINFITLNVMYTIRICLIL